MWEPTPYNQDPLDSGDSPPMPLWALHAPGHDALAPAALDTAPPAEPPAELVAEPAAPVPMEIQPPRSVLRRLSELSSPIKVESHIPKTIVLPPDVDRMEAALSELEQKISLPPKPLENPSLALPTLMERIRSARLKASDPAGALLPGPRFSQLDADVRSTPVASVPAPESGGDALTENVETNSLDPAPLDQLPPTPFFAQFPQTLTPSVDEPVLFDELPAEPFFTQSAPLVFTQSAPLVFTQSAPLDPPPSGQLPETPFFAELPRQPEWVTSEPGLPEAPFFAQSLAVPAPPPAPVDELPAAAPLVRVKPAPESQAASRHLESLIGAIDDEISAEVQASQTVSAPRPASDSNAQRYVVFHLGNTRYGLAIGEVLEMAIVPRTTPLPNVPGFVRGVANLRGEVLAVIDLRTFLSLEASPDTVRERLLVVRSPHGDAVAGLIVDSVRGLARLGHGAVVQPSLPLETRVADFLQGVSSHDDQVLNILDTRKLFTAPEIAGLSAN